MVTIILSGPDLQEVTGCRYSLAPKEMVLIFKHHHTEYTDWYNVYDAFAATGCTQLRGLAAHHKIKNFNKDNQGRNNE